MPLKNRQRFNFKHLKHQHQEELVEDKKREFRINIIKRIVTAIVLVGLLSLFFFFGASSINIFGFNYYNGYVQRGFGWTFITIGMLIMFAALYELYRLFYKGWKQQWAFALWMVTSVCVAYAPIIIFYCNYMHYSNMTMYDITHDIGWCELGGLLFGAFLLYIGQAVNLRNLTGMQLATHYIVYILVVYAFLLFNMIILLHTWSAIFIIFVPIFFNDTFAFFGGSWYGKHKMCEKISPNKTWEGAATGVCACFVIMLIIMAFYYLDSNKEVNNYGVTIINNNISGNLFGATDVSQTAYAHKWVVYLVLFFLGIATGILAICGDLLFSWFKRGIKIKDFSNWLPGHGGILDRLDSLLIVIIFFGLYQLFSSCQNSHLFEIFPYLKDAWHNWIW